MACEQHCNELFQRWQSISTLSCATTNIEVNVKELAVCLDTAKEMVDRRSQQLSQATLSIQVRSQNAFSVIYCFGLH